jgi:threonine aldolase
MTIDLRSDTVTKPTDAMRRAMASADVGDDERDGDPTMRRLEERVARMLGKERALFFPSGVMANQTGVRVLSRPGTEVLLDADAHIIHWEMAGAAELSGVQVRPVTASGLVMNADDLRRAMRPPSRYAPSPSLVCLENTHNGAGGKITPIDEMRGLTAVARERRLPVHLDGARLWNASVASGTSLADFAACADTVMVDFSKGLGAPIGAALATTAALADEAWIVRKRFGGAMRQSGILAAAALHALDHQLDRLAEDHARARLLAQMVDGVRGARVVSPDTNIVMIDLPAGLTSAAVAAAAKECGVLLSTWAPTRIRCVTHLDVGEAEVKFAGETIIQVLEAS